MDNLLFSLNEHFQPSKLLSVTLLYTATFNVFALNAEKFVLIKKKLNFPIESYLVICDP